MLDNFKKIIPNVITTIRICLALSIPFIFLQGYINVATIIFIIAAFSDALDGYLARKWNVVSTYGKTIDPFADKILSIGVLTLVAIKINPMLYLPLIMEGLIVTIGLITFNESKGINVEKIGKVKTAILFPTVALGLISNIIPDFGIAIIPMIGVTTVLQFFTIKEYSKKLFYNKNC